MVTLHQGGEGSNALVISHALVALYDRIFLPGQGIIPAINDALLGILLYKYRLVPRTLSVIGIAGAFSLVAVYIAVLFGFVDRISPVAGLPLGKMFCGANSLPERIITCGRTHEGV